MFSLVSLLSITDVSPPGTASDVHSAMGQQVQRRNIHGGGSWRWLQQGRHDGSHPIGLRRVLKHFDCSRNYVMRLRNCWGMPQDNRGGIKTVGGRPPGLWRLLFLALLTLQKIEIADKMKKSLIQKRRKKNRFSVTVRNVLFDSYIQRKTFKQLSFYKCI